MSEAKLGKGTMFQRGTGTGSPETFVTVAEVKAIGGFGSVSGLVDITNLDSLAKEYLLALKDTKQFTLKCNFLPTHSTQSPTAGMIKDHDDRTLRNFKMVLTDSIMTFAFSALVLSWEPDEITAENAIMVTFGLKISGAIAYS